MLVDVVVGGGSRRPWRSSSRLMSATPWLVFGKPLAVGCRRTDGNLHCWTWVRWNKITAQTYGLDWFFNLLFRFKMLYTAREMRTGCGLAVVRYEGRGDHRVSIFANGAVGASLAGSVRTFRRCVLMRLCANADTSPTPELLAECAANQHEAGLR